jgi:hypothetical protein
MGVSRKQVTVFQKFPFYGNVHANHGEKSSKFEAVPNIFRHTHFEHLRRSFLWKTALLQDGCGIKSSRNLRRIAAGWQLS